MFTIGITLQALQLYKELLYTVTYQLGKRKLTADSLTDGEIFTYAREVSSLIVSVSSGSFTLGQLNSIHKKRGHNVLFKVAVVQSYSYVRDFK